LESHVAGEAMRVQSGEWSGEIDRLGSSALSTLHSPLAYRGSETAICPVAASRIAPNNVATSLRVMMM